MMASITETDNSVCKLIAEAQDLQQQCDLMKTTLGYQRLKSKITAELSFLQKVPYSMHLSFKF